MKAFTIACSVLLFAAALAAPSRESIEDLGQQRTERVTGRLTDTQQQQQPSGQLIGSDVSQLSQQSSLTHQSDEDSSQQSSSSILIGGDHAHVVEVTDSPTQQRLSGEGLGDAIASAGSDILGHFTTEPPSFWDRVQGGIRDAYQKTKKAASDVGHQIRETVG